jgi:hypothetical protein
MVNGLIEQSGIVPQSTDQAHAGGDSGQLPLLEEKPQRFGNDIVDGCKVAAGHLGKDRAFQIVRQAYRHGKQLPHDGVYHSFVPACHREAIQGEIGVAAAGVGSIFPGTWARSRLIVMIQRPLGDDVVGTPLNVNGLLLPGPQDGDPGSFERCK